MESQILRLWPRVAYQMLTTSAYLSFSASNIVLFWDIRGISVAKRMWVHLYTESRPVNFLFSFPKRVRSLLFCQNLVPKSCHRQLLLFFTKNACLSNHKYVFLCKSYLPFGGALPAVNATFYSTFVARISCFADKRRSSWAEAVWGKSGYQTNKSAARCKLAFQNSFPKS